MLLFRLVLRRTCMCKYVLMCSGHLLPGAYSGPSVQVISSNVTKDQTTIGLRCSNCTVWSKGKLNTQSTAASFIYSYGNIEPTNPGSNLSSFEQHVDYGNFEMNLQSAVSKSASPPTIAGKGSTGSSSSGLTSRQWVLSRHGSLTIDHFNSWLSDGYRMGDHLPSRGHHHQIPREPYIQCTQKTPVRPDHCALYPFNCRGSRLLPHLLQIQRIP